MVDISNLKNIVEKIYILIIINAAVANNVFYSNFSTNILSSIIFFLAFIGLSINLILLYGFYSINRKQFYISIIFVILASVALFFKRNTISILYICALFSKNFNSKQLRKIYFDGILIGLLLTLLLIVFRVTSMTEINKNMLGFLIFSLVLYKIIEKNKSEVFVIFLVLFLFEMFIIKDRTAAIMSILIIPIYLIIKKDINSKLLSMIIIVIPLILFLISLFFAFNYNDSNNTMNHLNNLLSNRLYLWHFNFTEIYQINFLPQNMKDIQFMMPNGYIYSNTIDNAYLNFLIGYGFLQFALIIIFLTLGIIYAIDEKAQYSLIIIIILLIYSFTENIPFAATSSILLPLSFALIGKNGTKKKYLIPKERGTSI